MASANIYQKAASYLTKANKGKKRVPVGQVREILKDLCKEHKDSTARSEPSYLSQLLIKASEPKKK